MDKNEEEIQNIENEQINGIKNEINENNIISSENNNEIILNQNINSSSIIESIFNFNIESNLLSYPNIDKNNFIQLLDFFNKGEIPKFENKKDYIEFIKDKINFMKQLKEIIQNKYEILLIINKFFKKNNFYLFEYFVDLYFESLQVLHSDNHFVDIMEKNLLDNEIIKDIMAIINWYLCCGFAEKKNYDYVYHKLAALQLSKKLDMYKFCEYLNLLQILYGLQYDINYKKKLIAKNYVYFYDKHNSSGSGIVTNIYDDKNYIESNDGISIFLWFYLTNKNIEENEKYDLVDLTINGNISIKIFLDNKFDILVRYGEILLNNEDNNYFNIPRMKWVRLKIQIMKNQIKLNLLEEQQLPLSNDKNNENDKNEEYIKYKEKIFSHKGIPDKNFVINSIKFFRDFIGLVGTIIVCKDLNVKEKINPSKYPYGLKNNKIHQFLSETSILGNYFIFSPNLFVNEKNKFIDSTNNITGRFYNNKRYEFNGVFKYNNFVNNIYFLGGIENILPLFEIFYKFSYSIKGLKEENFLYLVFKKLMKLLELVLINKKNCLEQINIGNFFHNDTFFQILHLFLELIDQKFFQKDNDILNSLLNIGRYIYSFFFQKMNKNKTNFFEYILFSPDIIIKFNLEQQDLLWNFFDQGKNQEFKVNISDFKKIFMSFHNLNTLVIKLNEKYKHAKNEMPILGNSFMKIIKTILEDKTIKDEEREIPLLLIGNKDLNENIIKEIIEIYNSYLYIKDKNKLNSNANAKEQNEKREEIIQKTTFVNYILNSNNNYVESLLNLLTCNLRATKKIIIKFFQILILYYRESLENYFKIIDNILKKGKYSKKIDKDQFYFFLQQSLCFNNYIRIIPEKGGPQISINDSLNRIYKSNQEDQIKQQENKRNKFKRKYSFEFYSNIKMIYDHNDENNKEEKKKRNSSMKDKDIQKIKFNFEKDIEILDIYFEEEKITFIENSINQLKNNIKVNIDISEILVDLLIQYKPPNINSLSIDNSANSNTKKISSKNKNINIKNSTHDDDIILTLLKTFIISSKELEVVKNIFSLLLNNKLKTNIFSQLLDYFIHTKTDFIQLIVEILINSYLYLNVENYKNRNIFIFIRNNSQKNQLENEKDYFNIIYTEAQDLLISIFFYKKNTEKFKILDGIINIIFKISSSESKENSTNKENKIFNSSMKLYECFLEDVSIGFFNEINTMKTTETNKSEEKQPPQKSKNVMDNYYNALIRYNFEFISYLFEYYTLKNLSDISSNEIYKNSKMNINQGFPDYFNMKNADNYKLYYRFVQNCFEFFNLTKYIAKTNNSKRKESNTSCQSNEIYLFENDFSIKIINDYLLNKDYKDDIQFKIILFLKKNNNNLIMDFYTIVEIITIFNNYYIEKYLINEDLFEIDKNSKTNFNLIYFLNFHQFFIINIIIASFKFKENESNQSINIKTKEVQNIFYNCLEYNMNNIIKNSNSKANKYSSYFSNIFINIFSFFSKLYQTEKKNFNKTCLKSLIDTYSSKNNTFFSLNNLSYWSKSSFEENKNSYEEHKDKLIESIIPRNPVDMVTHSIINLFSPSKFIENYNIRINECNNLKLLLKYKEDIFESLNFMEFQDLKIQIKDILLTPYQKRETLYDLLSSIRRRKNYQKLKKKLYSWNYSYSNFDIFFKNNSEKLKFKISNFLSKDLSRRLLVPILDFEFYVPKFKSFDYKNNLFKSKKNNSEQNQYKDLYNIDLKISESIPSYKIPKEGNTNFFLEEVCYIKTNHHIHGFIFFPHKDPYHLYFAAKFPEKPEILINNSNYDSENKRCFGSIFSDEFNLKEREIYLDFSFSEINFIFSRKYCFRNNAIEIFSKYHRSYYFKFQDYEKRDTFLKNFTTKANKSDKRKYNFKPIKGLDEYNKSKIIGYYRDVEENKPYSSISNITDLWRNFKMSNFEYLMWINIYGNRSYQDISQYPVFPWLLIEHESKKFETLISKSQNMRDLRLPMGMLYNGEKGKERQEGYLESYKIMVMKLYEQNILKIKMKDEEYEEINNNNSLENTIQDNNEELVGDDFICIDNEESSNKKRISQVVITPEIIKPNMGDKTKDGKTPKFLDYSLDLDKYYFNLNIQYENIPYIFGSHFSNSMYVSHYLCRLFPYTFTSVEIQGNGFDCPDRLFFNIQNTINSVTSEKGDLREIIPDFFTLPELFVNINDLNLGFSKEKEINDVIMPTWCLNNPYYFVEKYRKLLECGYLNINSWIDLIFGVNQRGKAAENIGNIYLPFSYDGVLNIRLKPEELLKNREENEYKMRLFEMGVHPIKVFEKKCKRDKNKLYEQIILKEAKPYENIFYEIKLETKFKNVINFYIKNSSSENIYILDKSFIERNLIIQENKDIKSYSIKENSIKKELPFSKNIQRNIEFKLIVKQIFQNELFIITGLFDGDIHVYLNTNILEFERVECVVDKSYKTFDNSAITALIIDKNEQFLICGTQKGSLIIYKLNENSYREIKKDFMNLFKYFPSHPGYAINYISFNSNLSLMADCAYDGYVNIYSLPKISLVRSIYIDPNTENGFYNLDYVFLSAQPLGVVVVYSNEVGNFKIFGLNGKEIKSPGKGEKLDFVSNENGENNKLTGMISPLIFTDYQFNDYLIYILHNKYIFIHKFPDMQMIGYIICYIKNVHITHLCFSSNLKYIYAYDEINNSIYVVKQKNDKFSR